MEENKKNSEERQLVIFKIGKEEFGVDIDDVREIVKMEEITKIPNSEEYVEGVLNLRGKIIVIVDLSKKLRLPAEEKTKDTRIIVVEVQGDTIGMIVDNCNEVIRLSTNKIEPAPEIIRRKLDSDYLDGVGIIDQRLIILINLSKVLSSKAIKEAAGVAIKNPDIKPEEKTPVKQEIKISGTSKSSSKAPEKPSEENNIAKLETAQTATPNSSN